MAHTIRTPINAYEVLEMAQRIERNGASFYRKAAEQTASQDLRQILLKLAADEVEHEKVFAEMAEQLAYEERKVTLFEPVAEIAEHLATLADSKVFNLSGDFSSQLTGKETPADVLKIALDKEKDSIVFYLGLKDYVPIKAGRDTVDAVLRHELGHVDTLTRQLEQCT
jgi:rubrerythrin